MGTDCSTAKSSAEKFYSLCCGDGDDASDEVDYEAKTNGQTPQSDINSFDFIESKDDERQTLLTKSSNDALDSFLRHQFSDLTPEIIRAQELDPINEVWTEQIRGLIFRASIKLGPLSKLSQLTYDDLDLDDVDITYNETLHLKTKLHLTIKIRDTESLDLGLEAKIGVNPGGKDFDLSIPAKGTVRVIGLRLKCTVNLKHSLDIEWNDRNKSIEGTMANDLHLRDNDIEITYERIVVNFVRANIGDELTPIVWTRIEEAITGAVIGIFEKQITKLLNKVMMKEMQKILGQINEEVPKFEISFRKAIDIHRDGEHKESEEDIIEEVVEDARKGTNRLLNELRRLVK